MLQLDVCSTTAGYNNDDNTRFTPHVLAKASVCMSRPSIVMLNDKPSCVDEL